MTATAKNNRRIWVLSLIVIGMALAVGQSAYDAHVQAQAAEEFPLHTLGAVTGPRLFEEWHGKADMCRRGLRGC